MTVPESDPRDGSTADHRDEVPGGPDRRDGDQSGTDHTDSDHEAETGGGRHGRQNPEAKRVVGGWLDEFGDALYAYALSRVESRDVADELIQESFLAAFRSFDSFQGKASPKTWLTAILRNKIIEYYRRRTRKRERQPLDDSFGDTFDDKGIWNVAVGNWPRQPDQVFQDQEFWQAFQQCLGKLPATAAEVFVLRVLDGLDTDNICKTLKISSSNMAVRLHRARVMLRNCLGQNWFGDD